ncbi:MAG: efflux RND transporter periplasmic adaptor subunit [Nitrospinaceae bacterium]
MVILLVAAVLFSRKDSPPPPPENSLEARQEEHDHHEDEGKAEDADGAHEENRREGGREIKDHGTDQHSDEHEHEDQDEHHEKIISVSLQEMAAYNIQVKTAGPGNLETYVNLPGEIVVNADRLAHIVPRVSGIVREVRKNLGDVVRAGEIMAVLESSELGETMTEYFQRKLQLRIGQTDLARAQTIHDNTQRMLAILKTYPDPEIVLDKTKNLDMGRNRSRLISTYANFLLTRATFNREKSLYEKKISSQADYLIAQSEYKSAQAEYLSAYDEISFSIKRELIEKQSAVELARTALRAAQRHLHVLGISLEEIQQLQEGGDRGIKVARVEVPAPIAGTVIEKHITLGEMLQRDAKAFVLADLNSVWVNLNVYRKEMPLIRKGLEVIITAGKGIPDSKGTISYVRSLVGEETRTALARVVLPNPDGLWRPGLFVTGKVAAENIAVPLVIPKTAVQNIEGKNVVFIKKEAGFLPQPVTLGRTSETQVEVISGMVPGQRYVAQGGFTLKAQLAKGGFDSGHHH